MRHWLIVGAAAAAVAMLGGSTGLVREAMAAPGTGNLCLRQVCTGVGTACTSVTTRQRCLKKATFNMSTGQWTYSCSTLNCS